MTEAYIAGIEYALPSRRIDNEELARLHPEWNMEQIAARTGVVSRHWCTAEETALDMAEKACQSLFSRLTIDPKTIDALLFCTQSPDYPMPPNACLLQERLGLSRHIPALDFTLACSGFVYGLYLAQALIRSQGAKSVLLITAETYSKWMDSEDRGTITLFGDGAAATLVVAGKEGVGLCQMGTDGSGAKHFMVPGGGARQTLGKEMQDPFISMNGAAILDFIKKEIPSLVSSLVTSSGRSMDDIDLFIFHQGSKITLDYLHAMLHIPKHKRYCNLSDKGNTVSSSIPMALCDAEKAGILKPGMRVMAVGFGVGLSWGGCMIQWH